jgi:hypothetical protein
VEQRTRKAGRDKDTGEATKAADKRCPRDRPVLKANQSVIGIGANVDKNAKQDEEHDSANFK